MQDYLVGGIGKNHSWRLLSDKPFIVWSKGEFTAFESAKDAEAAVRFPLEERMYFWQAGYWHEIHFVVIGGSAKSIGFKP